MRGRCFAALLGVLIAAGHVAGAGAAERIYWANAKASKISFALLDGGEGGDLNTAGATVNEPEGTALDPAAGRIYWANASGNEISFARLDGSGGGDLNTGAATVNRPEGVAIDPVAGRIYWASTLGNRISFARLDGSGGEDLDTTGATVSKPGGLAIDLTDDRIYWANAGADRISFARLEGGGGGNLDTGSAPIAVPEGVAIDPATRTIYWANLFADEIAFARLDGSASGRLATGAATVSEPAGMAVDSAQRRIWWGNYGTSGDPQGSRISFASLDGTGPSGDLDTGAATVDGPVLPSLSRLPAPLTAPAIGGGSSAGSLLSCTPGAWASDEPEAFLYRAPLELAYSWSRDGAEIPGANGPTYAAAQPGAYRCRVNASNAAGGRAQVSEPHAIAAAPQQPPQTRPRAQSPRPVIAGLAIRPRSFAAARSGPSATASRLASGATVRLRLTAAATATVRFTVRRRTGGRRGAGSRCSAPDRGNRRARRCIRLVAMRGSFTRRVRAGSGSFRFTGRLRARRLAPGAYELVATPSSAGRRGAARAIRFAIRLR